MIAVGRADLADGVLAICDLLEQHGTIRSGGSLLHLVAFAIKQTEHRACQRLAVLLGFLQHHPVQLVPDHGIARHLAVGSHREGLDSHIQRIPGGRVGFLEGVGSGHNGDVGNFALLIGVFAVNGVAVGIVYLDERTRQLLGTGNIRFGDRHGRVDQAIQDRVFQIDGDDVFADGLICGGQRHRVLLRAEQPAVRHGQLPDVVTAVRIQTGEGQIALRIRRAGGHQRIGGQLLAVTIGDDLTSVQAKDKALAGIDLNRLVDHARLRLCEQQILLLLAQGHAHRQISVAGRHLDLNNRGLLIHGSQREGMRRAIKHITVRRGDFREGILAQRQHLGFD